ncbi:MAG: hypothetical protein ACRD0G_20865 [Acidimicrobiales bacterium]
MLLAELELWHTRPRAPTRRLALGHLVIPADPPPGFGGLLLGAVVAAHIADVDDDLVPDVHRLIGQVERGERIVQPRLRYRFQVDRHGLGRSLHQLVGEGDELRFNFDTHGLPLAMVLGAVYALERLEEASRHVIAPVLRKAMSWEGPAGPGLITHLAGATGVPPSALSDPRAWALEVLGFPVGSPTPNRKVLAAQFRTRMRSVHPDHGGDTAEAAKAMHDLATARKILQEAARK